MAADLLPPLGHRLDRSSRPLCRRVRRHAHGQYAGWVLQVFGSFTPTFVIAGSAYLVALAVVHLINPRYEAAKLA